MKLGPRWILYAAAAAIVLYVAGRWQGMQSVALSAAEANSTTLLHLKGAYLARISQLTVREQTLAQHSAQLAHRGDSLMAQARRIDTVTVADTGPVSLWKAVAIAESGSATLCTQSLLTCQERANVAEARAASLDSSLATLLHVEQCKILFVRCPSRTALFFTGAGLGLVGGLALHR
jgi:hypothetical protein